MVSGWYEYSLSEKKADLDNYHRTCDQNPPNNLDKCDLIQWKIQKEEQCIAERQQYMAKWNDTYQGHYDQIAQKQKTLEKLKQQAKDNNCCDK